MKKKRMMAFTMGTVMLGAALAGCGKSKPMEMATAANAEPAAESGEKQVLSVTTWNNDLSPQFSAIVDAYMVKNPNVEIKIIDTLANEYNDSLSVSLSAARPDPDVIWVKDIGVMLQMSDRGQLLPIDDFMRRDNFDLSVYQGVAEKLQYRGVSYALPYRSAWYVLYYNKDLFDAAGVEYPSNDMTWEEYYALTEKMTSGEGSDKVYGSYNHTWHDMVTNWAVQDGEHTVVARDYEFMKQWYEGALALQEKGFVQDYFTLMSANIHYSSVFKNEQCAMMPMGTWFMATMLRSNAEGETDFNWGIARIPHPRNTEAGYTVGSIIPIAISAYTDQPDLSWDFVKFAASREAAEILSRQGVVAGIMADEFLQTIASLEYFPAGESNVEALSCSHYVFDRPLDPQIEEIRQVFNEVHELIMIKSYSVEDGLGKMAEQVAEIKGW